MVASLLFRAGSFVCVRTWALGYLGSVVGHIRAARVVHIKPPVLHILLQTITPDQQSVTYASFSPQGLTLL